MTKKQMGLRLRSILINSRLEIHILQVCLIFMSIFTTLLTIMGELTIDKEYICFKSIILNDKIHHKNYENTKSVYCCSFKKMH